jgi:hypothetical protein
MDQQFEIHLTTTLEAGSCSVSQVNLDNLLSRDLAQKVSPWGVWASLASPRSGGLNLARPFKGRDYRQSHQTRRVSD